VPTFPDQDLVVHGCRTLDVAQLDDVFRSPYLSRTAAFIVAGTG